MILELNEGAMTRDVHIAQCLGKIFHPEEEDIMEQEKALEECNFKSKGNRQRDFKIQLGKEEPRKH